MDRSDRIARHTFTIFIIMFAAGLIRYFYKISMARMLGVRGYGLLSAVEPFMVITASLTLTGLAAALAKYLSEEIAKNDMKTAERYIATALFYIFPLAIGVSVFIFFSSGFIAEVIFHEPDLEVLIKIIVLIFPLEALWLVIDGVFLGYQESPYFTFSLFTFNVGLLSAAILLVRMGMGAEGAVAAIVIGDVLGLVSAYLIYLRKFKKKISLRHGEKSVALLKNLVNFAIPKTISSVSVMILMSFDVFCITYFLGVTYSGLYNAAVPVARVLLSVSSSICLPLLPAVSEDMAKEKVYVSKYLSDAVKYVSAATLPLVIVFVVYSKEIILLFFGEPYTDASHALMILSVAMLLMAYCTVFAVTFQGMGKPQIPMKITVFVVFFNILLNVYLIPRIGITGAAFSTVASMLLSFVYLSYRIREYADYGESKPDILKIGILSFFVFVIALIFDRMFLIGTVLGLAFYGFFIIKYKIIDIRKFVSVSEKR
jgi:stage V sporulation protein B